MYYSLYQPLDSLFFRCLKGSTTQVGNREFEKTKEADRGAVTGEQERQKQAQWRTSLHQKKTSHTRDGAGSASTWAVLQEQHDFVSQGRQSGAAAGAGHIEVWDGCQSVDHCSGVGSHGRRILHLANLWVRSHFKKLRRWKRRAPRRDS